MGSLLDTFVNVLTGGHLKKQSPTTFSDPNKVPINALRPGILNTLEEKDVDVTWDDRQKIASAIRRIKAEVNDAGRLSGMTSARGVIVANNTPPDDKKPIKNCTRATTSDSGYLMGEERGMCKVYIPELHAVIMNLPSLSTKALGRSASLLQFCTEAWGPREYMKKIKVGSIVEVQFTNLKDLSYGNLVIPSSGEQPDHVVLNSAAHDHSTRYGQFKDPSKPAYNPFTAEEMGDNAGYKKAWDLNIDELENERAHAHTAAVYHESIKPDLLKGFQAGWGPVPRGVRGPMDLATQTKGLAATMKVIDRTGKKITAPVFGQMRRHGGTPSTRANPAAFWTDSAHKYISSHRLAGQPVMVKFPSGYGTPRAGGYPTAVMHRAALDPYKAMVDQARKDGIPAPFLEATSTSRKVSYQLDLWNKHIAKVLTETNTKLAAAGEPTISKLSPSRIQAAGKMVGNPTKSNFSGGAHLSGLGVDLNMGMSLDSYRRKYWKKHSGASRATVAKAYKSFMHETSPVWKWMTMNAAFYGFYNYSVEPWHWEFVPNCWDYTPAAEPPTVETNS